MIPCTNLWNYGAAEASLSLPLICHLLSADAPSAKQLLQLHEELLHPLKYRVELSKQMLLTLKTKYIWYHLIHIQIT